ncbi:unnamed protein product [Trichobilharzia regenti]|nr:unnamed protein product [Trichobilharzia regenti]
MEGGSGILFSLVSSCDFQGSPNPDVVVQFLTNEAKNCEIPINTFLERTSYGAETRWLRFDELMFLFNLAIDPQGVIIQSFPRKENWPFPHYLGSCGRWSVEEYHGVPISHFCLASVWIRLQILLNILSLPEQLEHKSIMNQTYNYNYDEHYSSHVRNERSVQFGVASGQCSLWSAILSTVRTDREKS